jgi:hypothetical protein
MGLDSIRDRCNNSGQVKLVGVNSDSIAGKGDQKSTGGPAAEQWELEAVLQSRSFVRAPNLAAILRYVCDEYAQGRASLIKEYNIAVQALGRAQDFDPSQDSVVRVEVSRLRKRLQQFYENEGASHELQLHLADVGYIPRFVRRHRVESPHSGNHGTNAASGTGQAAASPDGASADLGVTAPAGAAVDRAVTALGGAPAEQVASVPGTAPAEQVAVSASTRRDDRRQGRLMAALGALALFSMVAVLAMALRDRSAVAKPALETAVAAAPIVTPPGDPVRISTGSLEPKYVDRSGQVWLGDRFFTGGAAIEKTDRNILRTLDPVLYRTAREGDFQYDIPVQPGVYELHLHFAELARRGSSGVSEEGERRFTVSLNGRPVLSDFDIVADAPGSETADERVFKDVFPAQDGKLHLRFSSLNGAPLLNGIEVLPGIPHRMLPVRILSGFRTMYDRRDQFWGADRYFWGGRTILSRYAVTADDEPALYSGDRYGNFTYYIPVALDGQYAATLRFAETYYGFENKGGPGSRVFDVYCNGTVLLKNFDVIKEAGAALRGVKRTFHGLKPNAQGKLVLTFVPVVDYATVRAIEVEDETR